MKKRSDWRRIGSPAREFTNRESTQVDREAVPVRRRTKASDCVYLTGGLSGWAAVVRATVLCVLRREENNEFLLNSSGFGARS